MGKKKEDEDDDERAAAREAKAIERHGIDERSLTPLGVSLPRVGFVPDAVVKVAQFVWLGGWIALFVAGQTALALVVMFGWIAANGAYAKHRQQLRRERKRQITEQVEARRRGEVAGAPQAAALPAAAPPSSLSTSPTTSPTERALLRTVRRVEGSDRFERRDVVLVTELSDVLFPLLTKVAEPGADPLVRRDVETIATEHLPATVDAYLALPADDARTRRNGAGRTPLEELRTQLDLLLTGCEQLRDAVVDADVSRQQAQSRFLEQKFRPSSLDL